MSDSAEALANAAKKLSPAERLEVIERLLDSLDRPDSEMDALWLREAEDRLAAYRRGKIAAIPLANVLTKYVAR